MYISFAIVFILIPFMLFIRSMRVKWAAWGIVVGSIVFASISLQSQKWVAILVCLAWIAIIEYIGRSINRSSIPNFPENV